MSKIVKRVCKCENCGNEAEMTISCSLEPVEKEVPVKGKKTAPKKEKGHIVCTHCGNEADLWVDL
ncbi:MAG: hypothetical protein PHP23_10195 [Desulfobacterales bacterium]|nr:hypothetical protein [Desulfobacterales bacterium]MDD4072333.1 hypothetical protein [Desulfobacterales bacterium]MDD4392399.1 hypothetical protein [Desulfobacterales bacterium]